MTHIHPTAYIAPDAQIGDNTRIDAFAVIESGVKIGAHCHIGAHSVIQPFVVMGDKNTVHPHVVLGDLPQDLHFNPATVTYLHIGEGNVFREGFTAHRATKENQATVIGSQCYFMNNSHVAHDCQIGNKTIFANNVAIGGHVEVGSNVFMGGGVVAHQFCRIGSFAIVQGTTGLNMDVIPFTLIGGRPAKHYRLNSVGLRRAGIVGENYDVLSKAFRLLRTRQSIHHLPDTDELTLLKDFLAVKSKRGLHGFVEL